MAVNIEEIPEEQIKAMTRSILFAVQNFYDNPENRGEEMRKNESNDKTKR